LSRGFQKKSVLAAGHGCSTLILLHVTAKLKRDQLKKQRRKNKSGTEGDHKEAPEQEQADLNLIPSRLLVATFACRKTQCSLCRAALKFVPEPKITFLGLPDELRTFDAMHKERGTQPRARECLQEPST
jgi:hypothetical protein